MGFAPAWDDPTVLTVTLRASASGPRAARRLVRRACLAREVLRATAEDAAIVAGALVANSIRQTRKPVTLHVATSEEAVTVRVKDQGLTTRNECLPADAALGASPFWNLIRRYSASYGYRSEPGARQAWALLRPHADRDVSRSARQ